MTQQNQAHRNKPEVIKCPKPWHFITVFSVSIIVTLNNPEVTNNPNLTHNLTTHSITVPAVGGIYDMRHYTVAQHQQRLNDEQTKWMVLLGQLNGRQPPSKNETHLLEKKLDDIQSQLFDISTSYHNRISFLQATIKAIQTITRKSNKTLLNQITIQLRHGDTSKAEQLLNQIEVHGLSSLSLMAKTAFRRAKIALDKFDYLAAFEHFQRATQYAPNNPDYFQQAAIYAGVLNKHQLQIQWNQQALIILKRRNNHQSPQMAAINANLGNAYYNLTNYQQAFDYYQQALQGLKKNYDNNHWKVKKVLASLALIKTLLPPQNQ